MSGRIFISYRRIDSAGFAGRIADYFAMAQPEVTVFMDVNSIAPGANFPDTIKNGLAQSNVLLALVGPQWLTASTESGARRLDDPGDFVRLELKHAIEEKLTLVPILLDDTPIPAASDLPEELRPLTQYNAFRLRHDAFRRNVEALAEMLKPQLSIATPSQPAPQSTPANEEVFDRLVADFREFITIDDHEIYMIIENEAAHFVQFIGLYDGEVLLDLPTNDLTHPQITSALRFLEQSYTVGTQDLDDGAVALQTGVPAEARYLATLTLALFEQVFDSVPTKPLQITFGK